MRARSLRRWSWVAALAGVLLLALGAPRARAGDEEKGKAEASAGWRDAEALEKYLAAACDAVEEVCGVKFQKRPTVRVVTAEEVKKVLRRELGAVKAMQGQDLKASTEMLSQVVLAKYDEEAKAVLVLPENAERVAKIQKAAQGPGEDDLRVLLAHEVTHALDWERFAWDPVYQAVPNLDGLQAFNAVSEGHAQWVAERVAGTWGIRAAFEHVTQAIVGLPADLPESMRPVMEALVAQASFAYVRGLEFVRTVEKARGLKGLEATLRRPPTTTRDVEKPERWLAVLDGTVAKDVEPELDVLIADLRTMVGDPAWQVQTMRLLEAVLRSQIGKVPAEDRAEFLRGYDDGRVFSGSIPGEDVMATGLVMLFHEPADAALFAGTERRTTDAQKGEIALGVKILSNAVTEGSGPGSALTGFVVQREVGVMGKTVVLTQQVAVVGRIVFELLVIGVPDLDRETQDAVLGRAALRLTDPAAAAKSPPPVSKRYKRGSSRVLDVHLTGPDGSSIPRFALEAKTREFSSEGRGRDGKARLELALEGEYRISVWGFEDSDGRPLPLAPQALLPMPAEGAALEVRLEPGLEIHGKVVDVAGAPVPGLRVEARAIESDGGMTQSTLQVHAGQESGSDGGFHLTGVNAGEYNLHLTQGGKPASARVTTTHGGARDVVVVMYPVRTLQLTVLDTDGKPVEGATVTALARSSNAARSYLQNRTDAGGHASLEDVDPSAPYRLDIHPGEGRPTVGALHVSQWKPSEEPLRLPRGYVVKGRVVDGEGKPAAARVLWRISPGNHRTIQPESDGSFTIPSVPLGDARISALPPAPPGPPGAQTAEERRPPWVKVTPENPSVTLVLGAPRGPDADVENSEVTKEGSGWTIDDDPQEVVVDDAPRESFDPPPVPGAPAAERVTLSLHVADVKWPRRGALARPLKGEFSEPRWFTVPTTGDVKVAGILPGRYALWIESAEQDRRCAYLPEVQVTGEPMDLRLEPAMSVGLLLKLPAHSDVMTVEVVGPLDLPFACHWIEKTRYGVDGLPSGSWTARVVARTKAGVLQAKVAVKSGAEPIEIEPKPK